MTEFAKILQQKRKARGLTLEQLAEKLGTKDKGYLSKLENDRIETKPSEELLKKMARELEIDYEILSLLAGKITKNIINTLDLKKVEIFRSMKDQHYTEQEFKNILKQTKKNAP